MQDLARYETQAVEEVAKEKALAAVADALSFEMMGFQASAGVEVTQYTTMQVSAALCAVRVIIEDIASLPVNIYQRLARKRHLAVGHPLYRLLRKQWFEGCDAFTAVQALTLHALLAGNGYAYINRGGNDTGPILELVPLLPYMVTPEQTHKFETRYYVHDDINGIRGYFEPREIFHLRGPSWDAVQGMDIVRVAAEVLGLTRAIDLQQSKFHAKGGRPSGTLSTEQKLSPEAMQKLRDAFNDKYGPNGEGGTAILDSGLAYAPMTMTMADAQTIESRRHQIEEVARIFRVHPVMLMHAGGFSSYASVEQFFLAHLRHTIMPWVKRWESAIEAQLIADDPSLYVKFELGEFLRSTIADRGAYYDKAIKGGWMTVNEVRELEDMNPVDGGDEIMLPLNMASPRERGAQQDPGPTAETAPAKGLARYWKRR